MRSLFIAGDCLDYFLNACKCALKRTARSWPLLCNQTNLSNQLKRQLLESKNDESRFGLTRAPFIERRGVGAGPKPSLAIALLKTEMLPEFIVRIFTALAFIYSLMIMLTVIVTLSKSARPQDRQKEKSS